MPTNQSTAVATDYDALLHGADRHSADRPVVAGVDGSPESIEAAEFAFRLAAEHGLSVLAVCAYSASGRTDRDRVEHAVTRERLRADLQSCLDTWPDVPCEMRCAAGDPAQVLGEASATAALVCVGARGLGGSAGLLLGSTAEALLCAATFPVAVVRSDTTAWLGAQGGVR